MIPRATLLKLLSLPYVRKHPIRTLLTTVGTVLGVAVFLGLQTADRSVLSAFSSTIDRIAGRTQLQVSAGEPGFAEEVLDRVQSAPSVRVAVPVVEAVVDSRMSGQGSLYVLGVDMLGDRSLRDYDFESGDAEVVDDPLVFLAQPDSIILADEFARKNHLSVGSTVTLGTALGDRGFTVRGIMKPGGMAAAFGGNLAVMDIYAAQKVLERGRRFDRIDVAIRPGQTVARAQHELLSLLGPGFQIEEPSSRGRQFDTMLSAYSTMSTLASVFALLIGMFLIHNAFAIAVTERRSEIGVLRALGATRAQIWGLFLWESAVLGTVGSLAGLAVGILMARVIAVSIGATIQEIYGVAQHVEDLAPSPALLAATLAGGVLTSVVAALFSARQAARMDPVQALQKGRRAALTAAESRRRTIIAGVMLLVSAGALTFGRSAAVFFAGYCLLVVAAVLLCPVLSVALSRAVRPILAWARPVEGALAVDSLIQTPLRTSASVSALMLSLTLVIALAGTARATYDLMLDWLDSTLNADLFVTSSPTIVNRRFPFPASMAVDIARIPGVSRVQTVRVARIMLEGAPAVVGAVEAGSLAETVRPRIVEGDRVEMFRLTAAGHGLIVSDILAQLRHKHFGQVLEIAAPQGLIRLPIVGIVVDVSDQQGIIFMDRALFSKYWQDDTASFFRLYVSRGAPVEEIKRRVLERYAPERQVFVLTNADLRAFVLKVNDQWFALSWIQIAVAVLVAILGIVNTLAVSIVDRRREFGVLRAVGGLDWQIRRMIGLEALSIGTLGLVLGFAFGAINLYFVLQMAHNNVLGMRLEYEFPFAIALGMVPTILGSALIAAIWPAHAVTGHLVSALEYE